MLRANPKKTKSARKRSILLAIGVGILAATILYWAFTSFGPGNNNAAADYQLQTPNQTFLLEAAITPAEQQKGLSGRSNLQPYRGMLFVFAGEAEQCFWMKDTLIPLDIIWLDAGKRVTNIERNVLPSSYPTNYCATGKYVVELNAGQADQAQIAVGRTLTLQD